MSMSADEERLLLERVEKFMENNDDELSRIENLADLEMQGYLIAPMICECGGVTAVDLLMTVATNTETNPFNIIRDRGIVRWCREQLGALQ